MTIQVKLKDVVDHLEMLGDETSAYLNKQTGELWVASDDEFLEEDDDEEVDLSDYPEWQKEAILKAGDIRSSSDWIALPGKFEIHEWDIMEQFCQSIEDSELSKRLLSLIRGGGAFRRFKNSIYESGMDNAWYQFRDAALERIAIDWLDENGIAYVLDDVETSEGAGQ